MPSISSVPKIQFTPAGLVVPTDSAVLAGVQADINSAFGGGVNPALETPQGQLASSQTAVIADKNAEIALMTNQVDPQYSDGRWQDAICRIYFLERKAGTATVVSATLGGLPGTTIAPGVAQAQDTDGNTYINLSTITIGLSSTVVADFENILTGPIPCAAGTLTRVHNAITGWDTITNVDAGVLGSSVESRADFEYRRQNSVAINAHGSPQAIYANVFAVPDVIDAYVVDNFENVVVNTGATNYPIAPHSVYVAVVGGTDAEVAQAIQTRKDLGCDMSCNTTVVVTDNSGYSYPQPTYNITFERPPSVAVLFEVQIVDTPSLPSDIVARTKAAIIARFNGADGTTRERIGSLILASRYYGAVVAVADNVSLLSILIGTTTPTLTQVLMGIDERPTIDAADITVSLV